MNPLSLKIKTYPFLVFNEIFAIKYRQGPRREGQTETALMLCKLNPKRCGLFGLLDLRRGADSARIEKT